MDLLRLYRRELYNLLYHINLIHESIILVKIIHEKRKNLGKVIGDNKSNETHRTRLARTMY